MNEWQPIEKAPREDTSTLMLGINMRGSKPSQPFLFRNTFVPDSRHKTSESGACWQEKGHDWPCYPTHWMPLPKPPDIP